MKMTLLTLNEPNLNGRTYTSEVVQAPIDKFQGGDVPVLKRFDGSKQFLGTDDIDQIIGCAKNLHIEGNALIGEIELSSEQIKEFESYSCRPAFIGKISTKGLVTDAELLGFAFTTDPA